MAEPKILYLCKYHKEPHYCKHTSRIEDALNFSEVGGIYVENEIRKNNWIPVTERLPEIKTEVIVTDIETKDTYCSWYIGEGFWECDNGTFNNRIIAWMPLPEPYEVGGNENG